MKLLGPALQSGHLVSTRKAKIIHLKDAPKKYFLLPEKGGVINYLNDFDSVHSTGECTKYKEDSAPKSQLYMAFQEFYNLSGTVSLYMTFQELSQ